MRRARGLVALGAWCLMLAGALAGLREAGHGVLAAPPLTEWSSIRAWVAVHDPVTTAMVALRLAAMAACWYLAAVTGVGALARCLRAGRLVAVLDRCTLAFTRQALTAALGAGLAVGSLSGGAVAAAAANPPPAPVVAAPTMHRLDAAPPVPPRMHRLTGADDGARPDAPKPGPPAETAPTSAPPAPSATPRQEVGPPTDPAPLPAPPSPTAAATGAGLASPREPDAVVTLRPGDHLWLVAERALSDAWRRQPTDREVAPYWRSLIERNRGRLVDPGNPDLVYPGQVITLPAVPTAAAGP